MVKLSKTGDLRQHRGQGGGVRLQRLGRAVVDDRDTGRYSRQRQPDPVQGLLLRSGNGLLLPAKPLLRPRNPTVPQCG